MDAFWKVAVSLAGLAGVVSFVLWSLYKRWLTVAVFSQLNSAQTYRLFRLFLILTFIFALAGFLTYLASQRRQDASSAELIDTLESRKRLGLQAIEEKRESAPTTQAGTAATQFSREYDRGMSEVIDALRKGQLNRAHEAQKQVIDKVYSKDGEILFDPVERKSFIKDYCGGPSLLDTHKLQELDPNGTSLPRKTS